jgi:hypothetical protein
MHPLKSPNSVLVHPRWCDAAHCTTTIGIGGLHRSHPESWRLEGDCILVTLYRVASDGQPDENRLYRINYQALGHEGDEHEVHFTSTDVGSFIVAMARLEGLPIT